MDIRSKFSQHLFGRGNSNGGPVRSRSKLLKEIAARGRKSSLGADLPTTPGRFLEHYYARAEMEDLTRDPGALAAAALGHLNWGAARAPGTAKVRVFNPTRSRDQWTSDRTIVQMANDDMPFLVDSAAMALSGMGHAVHLTIHPVLHIERDQTGQLTHVRYGHEQGTRPESFIHMEITREVQAQVLSGIAQQLHRTLRDVRAAVSDWPPMLAMLLEATQELRSRGGSPLLTESCAFLEWLANNHFTLLGYREFDLLRGDDVDRLRSRPGTGLGLLRDAAQIGDAVELRGRAREEARSSMPLVITKSNARSTVHRPALMDHIGVKVFDQDGGPIAERRFVGLFTSVAYNESPRDIPLLRHKVAQLMEVSGLDPLSHRGKNFRHILDTFPRDDLFQGSMDDLSAIAAGILSLQDRHRLKLFCRRETFGRFYSCFVYLPRDHYSLRARRRIEQLLLEGLGGTAVESEVAISESALARLVVTVRMNRGETAEPDLAQIEKRLTDAVKTWGDQFRAALIAQLPEDEALELYHEFADSISASYQEHVDPLRASGDVHLVARVHTGESNLEMAIGESPTQRQDRLRFTTFVRADPIELYVALPILENMGFKVISEYASSIRLPDNPIWIQDFELQSSSAQTLDRDAIGGRLKECFARVLGGDADNDTFNAFVVGAGLDWREAALLRAYCKYILQSTMPFSQTYMQNALSRFPEFCRALVGQFRGFFDPDLTAKDREAKRSASERTLLQELDRTSSLDEDRILRAFASVVGATQRTNFFQLDSGERKPYVSLKLDPTQIAELPRPRPKFEIFVYSRRVEGVHLRCGNIARGGLRWSDRREDFRTEVLGLMKAQQVKNTVIVPSGAKGGFVCKELPQGDRDAVHREVVNCYKTFVRGLLDLTDNVVDGRPVGPDRVLARDEPDTYLVVAADKGTATFSDIANGLSAEYGFWLGDAFASGGTAGYDHKKMAITARGAWEAVKRHFLELGLDTQNEPFSVIGIGDMSGDVFGNGMLLSPHLKLIAAFNHQHIFIDPDPDPATSFAERQRLFALPRSSWDDYDRSKLSSDGGIYSRQSKSIELDPAAQRVLDLEQRTVTPPELVRAILTARADLLWNGGIGTYVKASSQSHGDAGDPTNDSVRVDGNQLRCRVVAEGGNLGLTQLGRIEYALRGGRINTDFIDNSGGVDSSDREVNIKILLNDVIGQGKLARGKRDALLAEMTEDVAALVLTSNYGQTQALSMMRLKASERLGEHARLIRVLETRGLLDRALEFLPSEEQIDERRNAGRGLTRPELAVILSYSKIELSASLIESDIPQDFYLAGELEAYFPQPLSKRFKPLIRKHQLGGEIVAMLISSSIINRMGPFFVLRAEEETGANVTQVARAYAIVREVFSVRALWRSIEALDYSVQADVRYDSMFQISRMVRRAVYWFLQNYSDSLDIEPMVMRFRPGAEKLISTLPKLVTGRVAQKFEQDETHYQNVGFPPDLAQRVASLAMMTQALDVIELAREFTLTVKQVGSLYFELSHRLRLEWVREQVEALKVEGRWRAMARATLRETLAQQVRALARSVLQRRAGRTPQEALSVWLDKSQSQVTRVLHALDDMQTSGPIDFATLSVALKEVGRLI
jgi:glutamate dehydrogenase